MQRELTEISNILIYESEHFTKEQLKELLTLRHKKPTDLFDLYTEFKDQLESDANYDEAKHAHVVISKLKKFTGKESFPIVRVDSTFVHGFQGYLLTKVKNGPNTVNKEMQRFKRLLTYAKKEGHISHVPYDDYQALRKTKSRKVKLTLKQIESLENLKLKKGTDLDLVRDSFLFAFYCGGIRFGDVCKLSWKNVKDGRLVYAMSKTGRFKDLPLHSKPLEIIKKYKTKPHSKKRPLLPIIPELNTLNEQDFKKKKSSKNASFNEKLKELAKLAGIEENLATQISRHTFADYARREKIPLMDIMNMLGHSSLAVTQAYLNDLDSQSLDEGMQQLFEE
jgi:integrase